MRRLAVGEVLKLNRKVASLAEKMGHRTDAYIGYGGLALRDVKTAGQINKLEEGHGGKTKG
ncbi:hypothetical protein HRbin01_00900 [archaeon HR01]|nr:hypothetical protein HRbin01_00900 [archaeon HR01]